MALREGLYFRFGQLTLLLLTLVVVPAARNALAQDLPLPTVEASPTLFSTQLGSSQAKLQLSGSWTTDISGSLGYGFDTSGGGLFPVAFPGMTQGFNFQQTPNLDIALVLLDRYFFKTSFLDTTGSVPSSLPLGLNTFVLGYNGKSNEFLQTVRIGNSEVNMGDYGFLSFPAPSQSSIGASAKFKSGNGTYEAMIRYEPASLQRQVFVGHNEIDEQRLAPGSYVDGQSFVLPDKNVQNLSVYIEDPNGTIIGKNGRRYRVATGSDVVVNTGEGTIQFRKPVDSRVLVYYTVGAAKVGDSTLGNGFLPAVTTSGTTELDLSASATLGQFSWNSPNYYVSGSPLFSATSEIALSNGQNALLIYSPGEFSPFQSDNLYSLGGSLPQSNTTVSASLVPNGTDGVSGATGGTGSHGAGAFLNLPNGTSLLVSLDATDDTFTVLSDSTNPSQPVDPRTIAVRYPLGDLYSRIYTNGPGRGPQDTAQQILVRLSTPVTQYQLTTNILAGSVQITRNGVSDTHFTLDYSTGLLTFALPVADTDVIVATYRTTNTTKPGGDLLFGLGASFDLFPFLKLDIGTGLRWALFGGSYSTEEGTNTGSALLSAALSYNEDKTSGLRAKLQAGLSLSSPDTTGIFRLFGMEGAGTSVTMADGNMFPSSLPQTGEFSTAPANSLTFAQGTRGDLFYNDYHLYSAGGAVLQQIGWPVPSSQQYKYVAGSYTGPYPVYDPTHGTVMVMNYQMSTAQNWVGAQVPLSAAPEDLSSAESLTFYVNSAATAGDISAYVQIGSIGENLDGTSTLQTSSSTVVKAFPFDDNGTVLTTTGGASPKTGGIFVSEDTNGNGILDLEDPSLVVTSDITAQLSTGSWKEITVPLSAADRAKLASADAVRIILVNNTSGTIDSTFEVSSISIAKSPFNVNYPTSSYSATNTPVVQEVVDPQAAGKQLEDLFPDVKTIFHAAGQTQKVLEVTWQETGASYPAWTLTGYPNPVSAGTYKDLVFYLLDPSTTGATVTVNLTDQNKVGVHVPLAITGDNTWHKYSVDLTTGAISRDGQSIGQQATIDSGASRYTTVTISSSGATGGTIYLDEIYLSQPTLQLSAGATLDASYSKSGTVATLFGVPILRDMTVSEQAAVNGPGFASGFESFPSTSAVASYSHFQGRLPFGRLGLDFGVETTGGQTTISAGHNLTVPLGPVSVGDSYSQTVDGTEMTFNRSNQLSVSLGSAFSASVQDSSSAIGPSLTQNLQTTAVTRPPGPFSLTWNSLFTNQTGQYTPPSFDYFRNWADSFSLLGPYDQSSAARSGSVQVNTEMRLGSQKGPVSARIDLQPSASYQSAITTGRIQTDLGGLTLSVPVVITALGGITITPAYFRTFSNSTGPLSNPGFAADFATYGQSVWGADYFFDGIPFEELFSSRILSQFETATAGSTAASYQPGISLAVTRKTGSYLRDLFLPSRVQFSMSRDLERLADTVTDSLDWQAQYGTDALNLFGSAGAYPIFHFYRTDEFATNVDVSQTSSGLTSVVQNLFTLYLGANQQIQLDHRLNLSWPTENPFQLTDQTTLSFTYRLKAHIVIPYVPKQLQQGSYLANTESISFASSPDTLENSLQLNLNHETAMVLPDHGKITASGGIGFAENLISAGDRRILFGVQASIGAQLAF